MCVHYICVSCGKYDIDCMSKHYCCMNVCIGANKGKYPLIQCTMCHLYFHYRCLWLNPSVYILNFKCTRCKLAAAGQSNIQQPAVGHQQDHVTTETESANCDDDDMELLGDFFDNKNDIQPALRSTGKTKQDSVEDDDDDDSDCIMIDWLNSRWQQICLTTLILWHYLPVQSKRGFQTRQLVYSLSRGQKAGCGNLPSTSRIEGQTWRRHFKIRWSQKQVPLSDNFIVYSTPVKHICL